jgi:type IV secretion system protein TrbE
VRGPRLPRLRRQHLLSDWVPWLSALDDEREIVLTNSGGLLRVARFDAPDLETASPEVLAVTCARLTASLARLGSGWSVWLDQWRTAAPGYLPECDFGGCLAARLVDDAQRRRFTDVARPVFANSAFVALHYVPRQRDAVLAFLTDRDESTRDAAVSYFRETSEAVLGELRETMRRVEVLRGDPLSSYLFANVTFRPGPASVPTGLMAPQLACAEWHTSPALRVDDRHVATVEVRSFGSPTPTTCEGLHEFPFELRWVTALHALDPDAQRAEIGEVRKRWATKQKGIGAILTELVTRNPFAGRVDPEAERAVRTLDALQGELAERPFGLAHMNVHVWGATREEAGDRAQQLVAHLNGQGLVTREATINAVYAPLGDMAGNVSEEAQNPRRLRVELAAVTRVAPITGVSQGSRTDWRFGGPALLMGLTRRGVPLSFALNAPGSDRAHLFLVGVTGAGKSSALALMSLQFLRYPGARVIVFDRGRSFMVPCLAAGGDWLELGSGGVGVQPLRAIHRPEEMAWAHGWVMRALRLRGLETRPHTETAVSAALRVLADEPPERRTLSRLHAVMAEDDDARQTLRHYLAGQGPFGELFDGVVDSYGDAAVVGVETRDIIQLQDAAPLAITAMFRALQRDRLTGDAPKLVIVDEAWSLLAHPLFAAEIQSWAREMRKLKAVLALATQSLHELQEGPAKVIADQIGNRVYLPHAEAMRPQTRVLYEAAGLTAEQIQVISTASPKGEYLLQTEELTRLVSLRLEGDALRLCGASSPADLARAQALLGRGVRPGEGFTRAWLAQTTAEWLAEQGVATLQAAG